MAAVSISDLQKYVGKPITDICENEFSTTKQNHCAHFVGHVMEIQLGMLCGDMKYKTRKTGGSIRCDELYNRLSQRGPWEERPTQSDGVLIFALAVHNVVNGIMLKVPEKLTVLVPKVLVPRVRKVLRRVSRAGIPSTSGTRRSAAPVRRPKCPLE